MGWLDRVLGPGGRDAFAEELARALGAELRCSPPVYDREGFRLIGSDGQIHELENAWNEAEPRSRIGRRKALRNWARLAAVALRNAVPAAFDDAVDLLMPRIQARAYFTLLDLRERAEGREPMRIPHRVLAEHYAISVVCDFPESVSVLNSEHLARWGRSFDDVLALALVNLRRRPPRAAGEMKGPSGASAWTALSGDTYDATRLLVLEDALPRARFRGDPVAVIPHRDALCVTGAEDAEALEILGKVAEDGFDRPYPIGTVPLRRVGGTWEPWIPPPGHPAHEALRDARARSIARDYDEQTEPLQAAMDREGRVLFVAACMRGRAGAPLRTLASWAQGVLTLLPETDEIGLSRPRSSDAAGDDDEFLRVRWADAVRVCGARMTREDLYPVRWRVESFPDDAEWARLREVAVA